MFRFEIIRVQLVGLTYMIVRSNADFQRFVGFIMDAYVIVRAMVSQYRVKLLLN